MTPPRTTFDPKTAQYCCPVIIDTKEPAGTPWHVAYVEIDINSYGTGMVVDVTEIVAPDGSSVDLSTVDVEWISDQCREAISSRDYPGQPHTFKVSGE